MRRAHTGSPDQLILEDTVPRTRAIYARWRNGLCKDERDENEMCMLAQRTGLIAPSGGAAVADPDAEPFEKAHPALRRAAEQAGAEGRRSPPAADLAPARVGAVYSSTGVSQAYSTSAERTGGGQDRELPSSSEPEPPAPGPGLTRTAWDLQDSSWMTWF